MNGLTEFARRLRRGMTSHERRVWGKLRDRRLAGFKFRRQHPMFGFVGDFYCREGGLVVEVDGAFHDPIRDQERDRVFKKRGIDVLRLTNDEVEGFGPDIEERILRRLKARMPGAPPQKGKVQ